MNILSEIAEKTRLRIEAKKHVEPFEKIKKLAEGEGSAHDFPFESALKTPDISFICEIKRASPSYGIISEDFPYLDIAKDYEAAGAAAISVLTEPYYFKGDDQYLREISETVNIPTLRKDFTIDSYMLYEAKLLGASAVLLICSILDIATLREYINISESLGLSALVETHDAFEIDMALKAGARIIGVNNRNLKTLEIDLAHSENLRNLVPSTQIFIAESGIKTSEDVERMRAINADAVLIGETIMKSPDRGAAIRKLRGKI